MPTVPPSAPTFSSPPTSPRGSRWGLLIAVAVVVAVLFVAAVVWAVQSMSSDAVDQGDLDTSVYDLAVGDCFDDPSIFSGDDSEILGVASVACDEPHDAEVYALVDLPDGDGASYPGDDEVFDRADDLCFEEFEPFVGAAYDDSSLDFIYYVPGADSWDEGDRSVACMVVDMDGEPLTGSMEGSGR